LLFPVSHCHSRSLIVIPANAGIQKYSRVHWMPAFAGMTMDKQTTVEVGARITLL